VTTAGRSTPILEHMDTDTTWTGARPGTGDRAGARPPEAPGGHPPETTETESDYVLWTHVGSESVFFYPPESVEEHLVTDHGIPSVNMHWKAKGSYDHARDHLRQRDVGLGAVGDLLAVPHPHQAAA
jgi:hypothetical protein